MSELFERLQRGLNKPAQPSSDFDLNPGVVLPENPKLRQAAVLVPFDLTGPEPRLILTKRSAALKHHPGQISFPGGKVEQSDLGPVGAALREANEEIGLPKEDVDIIGALPGHETVTGFVVEPVLASVSKPFSAVLQTSEVAEVFSVPASYVLDPANFVVEGRKWQGVTRRYYVVPYGPYYIWGATARILRGLAERVSS